jgi:hypothetical protein
VLIAGFYVAWPDSSKTNRATPNFHQVWEVIPGRILRRAGDADRMQWRHTGCDSEGL